MTTEALTRVGRIPVVELFGPTIQGEGALCGQVSYFLRTGFCTYDCLWCDSLHAVTPARVRENAKWLTAEEILDELIDLRGSKTIHSPWVTLTGGDPVLWDLATLVAKLFFDKYRVAVETQGALWRDWLESCDLVTVSPKPPSSGMDKRLNVALLQKYRARLGRRLVLKVVVFDDEDLDFARRCRKILFDVPFYLSSGTPMKEETDGYVSVREAVCRGYKVLAEKVCADPLLHDAVVLPQLHVLLWGRDLGR